MSLAGLPDDAEHRQALLASLASGAAARLALSPGIELCRSDIGTRVGLTLRIHPEALQAGQVQHVLEQRYEQAQAFAGCCVYLELAGALVIWHDVPSADTGLDRIFGRMLSLAQLQALDRATHRL